MTDLGGRVAWVTGAGSGIGEAACLALAGAGATLVLTGRRAEPLEAVAARVQAAGGTALALVDGRGRRAEGARRGAVMVASLHRGRPGGLLPEVLLPAISGDHLPELLPSATTSTYFCRPPPQPAAAGELSLLLLDVYFSFNC